MSPTTDVYEEASRLVNATPEQLEIHQVALALQFNHALIAHHSIMEEQARITNGYKHRHRQGETLREVRPVDGAETTSTE